MIPGSCKRVGNPANVLVMVAQGKSSPEDSRQEDITKKDNNMSKLIYNTIGRQIGGINSEVRFEDLGKYGSRVEMKKGMPLVSITFALKGTDIIGVGRNRLTAFHSAMAAKARANYEAWKRAPKAPAVNMNAIRN